MDKEYQSEVKLSFPDENLANQVKQALEVDPDLRPERTSKQFSVVGNILIITINGVDLKSVRASTTSIFDFAKVAVDTIRAFRN
eukprot:maker-scaffold_46-snap-gene-1.99-mRNA-1 protein AED:0.00 eAED:0.00 QI:41/1/1/1/1/1/3/281/83